MIQRIETLYYRFFKISFYSIIHYIGLFPLLKTCDVQRNWEVVNKWFCTKEKKKKISSLKVTKQPRNETQRTKQQCRSNMNHCVKSCCVRPSQENHLIDLVLGWGQKRQLIVCVSHIIHDPDKPHVQQILPESREKQSGLKKKKKKKKKKIVSPLLSCKTFIVSR